jgi:hypothetical protein
VSLIEFIALAGFLGIVVLIAKVVGRFEKHMMEDDEQ